jgi:hypothetical protein
MAFVVKDRVKVTTTTTGTGTLTLGAAAGISFQDFSVIGDGNTTSYTIVDPSTGAFEVGIGTYTASGTTLSRDVVLESSNSGSLVNFAAGLKEVFVAYPAERAVVTSATPTNGDILVFSSGLYAPQANPPPFPTGTKMLFQQTAAPTGWTKDTTHDNKALRVVSGTASTGGTVAFTTAFASQAVTGTIANATATNQTATQGGTIANATATNQAATQGGTVANHTLSTSQIPSHDHSRVVEARSDGNSVVGPPYLSAAGGFLANNTVFAGATGGGGSHNHSFSGSSHNHTQDAHNHSFSGSSHNHTQNAHNHSFTGTAINLAVSYVDLIIATKD